MVVVVVVVVVVAPQVAQQVFVFFEFCGVGVAH